MTTLRVDDIPTSGSTIEQDFTVAKRQIVPTIQLNLIFVNAPSGTFTLTVKEGSNIVATNSQTYAQIASKHSLSGDPTHHGFFNFDFSTELILNEETTYTLELSTSGYTLDLATPSFGSWVLPHSDLMPTFSITTTSDDQKPLGFRIWSFQNG